MVVVRPKPVAARGNDLAAAARWLLQLVAMVGMLAALAVLLGVALAYVIAAGGA